MTYATNTAVPSERSRAEIERTLERYGADAFGYGTDGNRAVVQFRADGVTVRFELPLPDDDWGWRTPGGRTRGTADRERAKAQEIRRLWRALALIVKAKLEAVESGVVTFEEEFMAHIVLPSGQRVADWMLPQIEQAYETGEMPNPLQLGSGS